MGGWAMMIGFGAYHGLNPGMGWLFALALGLQQKSERAIWRSMLPITTGHAASIVLVAALVLAAGNWLSITHLRYTAATVLLVFAVFKLFNTYRHPRWVGMRVGMKDLFLWSFLMAAAHGAGLMVAPVLLEVGHATAGPAAGFISGVGMLMAILLHTTAMLMVMLVTALVVFRKLGLAILRRRWVNFDMIWAVALLVVGSTALYHAARMAAA
ncbi:MAG: hypothetical protein HF981_10050 [Desulfobacteraceae bacterium]|nr:hypothetical protein [Desulfobacteraceae bacterium]MBC2750717.1 hypothetical protein [Desulfobacteraceae bacterium]